jgi:hypothetical protein
MRAFIAFTTLLVGLSAWAGYRWGHGPETALEMWAQKPRQRPQTHRQPRESQREDRIEVIQRLKRDEFLISRDYLRGIEAWNHVKGLSLAQVKEALATSGENAAANGWGNLATLLFHRWGELDPEEAMRHVRQLGEAEAQNFGPAILVAWMKNDPEAAYRWSLGDRKFAESIGFDFMLPSTLMSESAASAMEKAKLLGDGISSSVAMKLAQAMSGDAKSRAEFLSAISSLDKKPRQDAIGTMIRVWSSQAPDELLKEWNDLPIDGEQQKPLLNDVLKLWGKREPAKAVEWMTAHPEMADLGQVQGVYKTWLENDAATAERWLLGRSDPGAFAADIAKQMHSESLNDTMGLNWSGLSQEEIQHNRQTHYRIWAQAKPDEAARWLESIGPEAAKTFTGKTDARQ